MDKFLRGDDGLPPLLSSDTLQAQLDSKVHKNDHAVHADTLSAHAVTLNTLNTALAGKQDEIDAINTPSIKSILGLGLVDNTRDLDKPISSTVGAVHTSLEARLTVLESFFPTIVPVSQSDNIDFTASLDGKNIQLMNTATGMYTIYVQDAPISRGNGMRMVDETNIDTNMMGFWAYTTPNEGAQAPDDSIWLVNYIPGTDGMMRLTNTYNTDFIWGNGITPSGVNGHMEYWHNNQGHPEWAAQTGGQDYGGAAEVNPSSGVILEKVDGINQYLVNFPAQDGEPQYLVLIQPTASSGLAFLCRKDKMADFIFDTNDVLLIGTNEERNYKLATMTLRVIVDPVSGVQQVDAVSM